MFYLSWWFHLVITVIVIVVDFYDFLMCFDDNAQVVMAIFTKIACCISSTFLVE